MSAFCPPILLTLSSSSSSSACLRRPRLPPPSPHSPSSPSSAASTRPRCSLSCDSNNVDGSGSTDDNDNNDSSSSWGVLSQRLSVLREKELIRDRKLARNWKSGVYGQGVIASLPDDFYRKVSFNGDFLACGTLSGTVCFHHLPTRKALILRRVHTGQVTALAYGGSHVASASTAVDAGESNGDGDGNGNRKYPVAVWRAGKYERSKFWQGLDYSTTSIPAGVGSGTHRYLYCHSDVVTQLAIDGKEGLLYSAGNDGYVHVHHLGDDDNEEGKDMGLRHVHSLNVGEPVYAMRLTEKGYLLLGVASGYVKAYKAKNGTFLLNIKAHETNTTALDFFEDGQTLVTGDAKGNVRAWSFLDSSCLGELPGHDAAVMSIQVDHTKVVSAGRDGKVNVSLLSEMKQLYSISGFTKFLATASFDDTRLIADGTNDVIFCHYFDIGVE